MNASAKVGTFRRHNYEAYLSRLTQLMDVRFYEVFDEEAEALRRHLGKRLAFAVTPGTIQESGDKIPPARLISIRTQSVIPLEWTNHLSGVLSRSTGFDHLVPFQKSTKGAIPCGYLEEYATRAVAEHAMLMAMALIRKLPGQVRNFSTFDRNGITGVECVGKHLLVIGVGRIGSEIVKMGKKMGFEVRGVDIVRNKRGVDYVAKNRGLAWADAIVFAMNLTDVNKGYLTPDLVDRLRKGCVVVNVGRGEHTPTSGLERGLKSGTIGGLALDVYEDEPTLADALRNPSTPRSPQVEAVLRLAAHPNVLFTPHNAFNTRESVNRKAEMTVKQIRHFLAHGDFVWKL